MTQLTTRFDEALLYARAIHGGQKRKGSDIPYFAHLLGVASLTLEAGGSEDQAIAALLHDAAEDQGGHERLEDIRSRFGGAVADIVGACSDSFVEPKPDWEPRKKAYLEAMDSKSSDALLVSLADKIHNAEAILADFRSVGPAVFARFTGRRVGTLWYYRTLADAFTRLRPGAAADRLARAVAALHSEAEAMSETNDGGNR